MNNKSKTLFVFLLLAAVSMAQSSVTETQFQTGTTNFAMEIGNSWQLLAVLALMVSAAIVAIGYAVGIGFEIPELKAWAGSELVQIVTNAIIILVLIGAIAFVDVLVIGIVMNSNLPLVCNPGESCLQKVTNTYLADYVAAANTGAKGVLINNIKEAAAANRRIGFTCLTIYCLQFGFSTTLAGQKVLDQDYYAIIFEYYTNLLAFMESQKFFVGEICFKMAPVVLAMGIVARSFFFTRKLGGLLMAVAIGAMFFFPGMYIFDWVTLDMALNGDKVMDTETSDCPAECAVMPPLAYYYYGPGGTTLGTLNTTQDVAWSFNANDPAETLKADGLLNRGLASTTGSNGTANGRTIYSCYYAERGRCPAGCRELPYPQASPICAAPENQSYCYTYLPVECKIRRYVKDIDMAEYGKCPASCRIIPPLKSDCNYGADTTYSRCINSRFDCRMTSRNDISLRPQPPQGTPEPQKTLCTNAAYCPASMTAVESCVYVMPETGKCNDLCPDCPAYCRISGNVNLANMPAECKTGTGAALTAACLSCRSKYDSCTADISVINAIAPVPPSTNCNACPAEKRLIGSGLPDEYTSDGCSMDSCGKDYRAIMPRSTCEACLFSEESYTYDPPINTRCGDMCAPSSNVPASNPGEYMNIGGGGLVGKPAIQDVAKLMLPIYVLPLFNIVITLVFIKAMSGYLGGDIEIPGLSKVF